MVSDAHCQFVLQTSSEVNENYIAQQFVDHICDQYRDRVLVCIFSNFIDTITSSYTVQLYILAER